MRVGLRRTKGKCASTILDAVEAAADLILSVGIYASDLLTLFTTVRPTS